ncbi:MAG TPA: family 43 glycosylhydrolase, partial [Clostridia bacterium]|nr:family 43 glycosylhydrolase [Clostridia bacterium]
NDIAARLSDWRMDTRAEQLADRPRIPYVAECYQPVYRAKPDAFAGPDTAHFQQDAVYEDWVPNDFALIHDGLRWHIFGITHPCPPGYRGEAFDPATIHEGEWQLFHAVSESGAPLRDLMRPESFVQCPQVLRAKDRPDEPRGIYAPVVFKKDDAYWMLYSPDPFRWAESKDLFHWTPKGIAFTAGAQGYSRDPNIFHQDGTMYCIYLARGGLFIRTIDTEGQHGEHSLLRPSKPGIEAESPILFQKDGWWYLLYCEFDPKRDQRSAYGRLTRVYAAKTLNGLYDAPLLTTLPAHAPEVVQDFDGVWYLASAEFPWRG